MWRGIKALEASGVIRARVALLDGDAVGLGPTVFMMIRTDRRTPDWLARFAQATRDMPAIMRACRLAGDLDYLIRGRVSDVKSYDRLYQDLVRRVDLHDVSASFVMEEIKDTTALSL